MKIVTNNLNGIRARLNGRPFDSPLASRAAPFLLGFVLAFVFPVSGVGAVPPRPAPPIYASHGYVLTFRTPRGATYCPLPAGWVGSDHGTTIFLERPRECGNGAGFPSSNRSFAPGNVARINVYYAYRMPDPSPRERCRRAGRLLLLGRRRTLCRSEDDGMISFAVQAIYRADIPAEAILTLRTRPARLARDLAAFRRLAASLRTCTASWPNPRGQPDVYGSGAPCPRTGTF